MARIMVDVGIRGGRDGYGHEGLGDVELDFEQALIVVVFVEDGQPVVATEFQRTAVVGDAELIMGV